MRYIKTYDSINNRLRYMPNSPLNQKEIPGKFWVIHNDDNFNASLYKIGMDFKNILVFRSLHERYDKHYFIGFDGRSWTYCDYNYASGSNLYTENGYKFMGFVETTEEDVEKYKYDYDIYNLQKDEVIGKYNL